MKNLKYLFILSCMMFVFASCKKDNYDAPDASIHGALTDGDTGGPLELSQAGSNSNVRMIVNNPAKYPTPGNFDLAVKGDGTFSNSTVFPESYKVVPLAQSGPWQYLGGDSTRVTLASGQDVRVDFKVYPFFRITAPSVADSTVTFTVTKATATPASNGLTTANNLLLLINNSVIVNESVSSNRVGSYYQNQFQFTVTNAILGNPYTPAAGTDASTGKTFSFNFSKTHLPKGEYYLRVAVLGSGSNGKYNYSPVVKFTIR
ncbi:DUF3823 domain-containing protein [Mucilaginibacter sp. PAMB04168]|uniref:DUF3823 domain-containing protein n=1 Tax=Mucilaginibacter sp. PAMB04168 TaxID=3138567 RepID=UPI0031F6E044